MSKLTTFPLRLSFVFVPGFQLNTLCLFDFFVPTFRMNKLYIESSLPHFTQVALRFKTSRAPMWNPNRVVIGTC